MVFGPGQLPANPKYRTIRDPVPKSQSSTGSTEPLPKTSLKEQTPSPSTAITAVVSLGSPPVPAVHVSLVTRTFLTWPVLSFAPLQPAPESTSNGTSSNVSPPRLGRAPR